MCHLGWGSIRTCVTWYDNLIKFMIAGIIHLHIQNWDTAHKKHQPYYEFDHLVYQPFVMHLKHICEISYSSISYSLR